MGLLLMGERRREVKEEKTKREKIKKK